ncbi:MAG: DUF4340 domain-containing protein [Anaerolineae bacterium]|nr:DUF4340 domain-containing protein [Anaerolineae bacterium]MDW8171913.1 DUF4340 domain-containing protein [Anaerolineae bacterium]
MKMNRNTLIFLVAGLVVIGLALLALSGGGTTDTTASPTPQGGGPLFPDVAMQDVKQLTIRDEASGNETTIRQAEDGAWVLEGRSEALTQTTVDTAVSNLVNLRAETRFSATDLAQYGLDAPTTAIRFTAKDQDYSLLIGRKNPSGTRYYALVGDDRQTVHLVTGTSEVDGLARYVNNPPIVQPTPTPGVDVTQAGPIFSDFSDARITALRVAQQPDGPEVILERDEDGQWRIAGGADASRVDQTAARLAVQDFGFIRAEDVVDDAVDLTRLGLDAPRLVAQATRDDGFVYELRFGGEDPTGRQVYAQVNQDSSVLIVAKKEYDEIASLLTTSLLLPEATPEATAEATP